MGFLLYTDLSTSSSLRRWTCFVPSNSLYTARKNSCLPKFPDDSSATCPIMGLVCYTGFLHQRGMLHLASDDNCLPEHSTMRRLQHLVSSTKAIYTEGASCILRPMTAGSPSILYIMRQLQYLRREFP
jgi:hypothetical protein